MLASRAPHDRPQREEDEQVQQCEEHVLEDREHERLDHSAPPELQPGFADGDQVAVLERASAFYRLVVDQRAVRRTEVDQRHVAGGHVKLRVPTRRAGVGDLHLAQHPFGNIDTEEPALAVVVRQRNPGSDANLQDTAADGLCCRCRRL